MLAGCALHFYEETSFRYVVNFSPKSDLVFLQNFHCKKIEQHGLSHLSLRRKISLLHLERSRAIMYICKESLKFYSSRAVCLYLNCKYRRMRSVNENKMRPSDNEGLSTGEKTKTSKLRSV